MKKELATLSYMTVDEVTKMAVRLGHGALLEKMDIRQAHCQIPIHPQNRSLLGMLWEDKVYIDTPLSFSLKSALLLFTAIADAMHEEAWVFHYIDNFITLRALGIKECAHNEAMHKVWVCPLKWTRIKALHPDSYLLV